MGLDFGSAMDLLLTWIFAARSLDAGHDANAEHNDGNGHNIGLRDVHKVREIRNTNDQNEVTDCIDSKGHVKSPGAASKAMHCE
jgi:hypothetical protein